MEIWQKDLRNGFRDLESLLKYLDLAPKIAPFTTASEFSIRIPLSFANRITKGNPNDPLLLQAIPLAHELESPSNYKTDAVGDLKSLKQRGLIQKYKSRVLIIATSSCAIHCRYCFRRHFPYSEQTLDAGARLQILNYLKSDSTLDEVIFSGGDPLLLSDAILGQWSEDLKTIPHIKRWRFHTRLPSVLPSRITSSLTKTLSDFQARDRQIIMVTHINHPNEINDEVRSALELLDQTNIVLLNQSVLLKNINDSSDVLKKLSKELFASRVLPYYLHLLDRTQGTHHFEVAEPKAKEIYQELAANLPGYLLPKLVREIEGQPNKVLII